MQAFLERFYEDVDANLNDPSTSKRITKAKKLRLLYTVEKMIWERILMISGQESIPARAETTIAIENDKEFYPLPGNFRQFLGFERRVEGDSRQVVSSLDSIPMFDRGPGVKILSGEQGMLVVPKPSMNEGDEWTLIYQKGPVRLHHATALGVTAKTITAGTPAADAGELILNDDYYIGSLLRIHEAATGQEQVAEVVSWDATGKVFHLRHPWNTLPTGTVQYEVRPLLPADYDELYAMDVAIRVLGRRARQRGRAGIKQDRDDLWRACKNYFISNVADRGPARITPLNRYEPDPYD